MNEKRRAHYPLLAIKAAFASPTSLNRTLSAVEGGEDLGMDDADVVATVQSISKSEFVKSMTSHANPKIWQDVYKSTRDEKHIYIKFTVNAQGEFLLISFKEA